MKAEHSVAWSRLESHTLLTNHVSKPEDIVSWFGAMQSQDFAAAKWAIGVRMNNILDKEVEQAFNEGKILRTHILRPTWHFVHPQDIRWMLALTAPRLLAHNGYYFRQTGLDRSIFDKSNRVIRTALSGGKQLSRTELRTELERAKVPINDLGFSYTLMQAELGGVICSGPKKGKYVTYMLLDERVPKTKEKRRDDALKELAVRFFQSHGPAQTQDFVWWSGLTTLDAKQGIAMAGLEKETVAGKTYWFTRLALTQTPIRAILLPPFDEYIVAYKDRNDILDGQHAKYVNFGGGMINGSILIDGIVRGTWKRVFTNGGIGITLRLFTELSDTELGLVKKAADQYGKFHSLPVTLKIG